MSNELELMRVSEGLKSLNKEKDQLVFALTKKERDQEFEIKKLTEQFNRDIEQINNKIQKLDQDISRKKQDFDKLGEILEKEKREQEANERAAKEEEKQRRLHP